MSGCKVALTLGGMALGTSWGILRAFTEQVANSSPPTSISGDAVFTVKRPELAEGARAILEVKSSSECADSSQHPPLPPSPLSRIFSPV